MKLMIRILFAAFVLSMVPTVSVEAQGKIESPLERKARLEREAAARKKKQQQEAAAQRRREEEARKKAEEEAAAREAEQQAREKAAREQAERDSMARVREGWLAAEREEQAKKQAEQEKKERAWKVQSMIHLVRVAVAPYKMGATEEQGSDVARDEKPVHKVTLNPYMIAEYPVTQELWETVTGGNPSRSKGAKKPVVNVSLDDCRSFIKQLNELTGETYRLPTEAEWEYAARGGKMSRGYRYAGSNNLDEVAWYEGNSSGQLHEVGQKKPNELRLYDMSGNVFEWCADWYTDYPSTDQTNPLPKEPRGDDEYDVSYVARGGSMRSKITECRASFRRPTQAFNDYEFVGLRLAMDGYEGDLDEILTPAYEKDGIVFKYGQITAKEYFDMEEEFGAEYEDEMIDLVAQELKNLDLPKKDIYEMIEMNGVVIVYLIVTSDHSQKDKLAWIQQCKDLDIEEDPAVAELGARLYREIYEDLKKKNK